MNVRDIIRRLRVKTADERYFVPHTTLKATLTRDVVIEILRQNQFSNYRIPSVATSIVGEGIRTFAILILLGQDRLIGDFIDHAWLDSKLPMDKDRVCEVSPLVSSQFCEEIQWELCAHILSRKMPRKLRWEAILPHIHEERIGEGAGGEIFKCSVATEHQLFYPENEVLGINVI